MVEKISPRAGKYWEMPEEVQWEMRGKHNLIR